MLCYRCDNPLDRQEEAFLKLLGDDEAFNRDRKKGSIEPWPEETVREHTQRIMSKLRKSRRIVSQEDFDEVAERVKGVRRVWCVPREDLTRGERADDAVSIVALTDGQIADWEELVIQEAPSGLPRGIEDVSAAMQAELKTRRLLTTQVRVVGPRWHPLVVKVGVRRASVSDGERLAERTRRSLGRFLHPLYGGPDGRGWRPGRAIAASELLRVLHDVPEVTSVTEVVVNDVTVFAETDKEMKPATPLKPGELPLLRRCVVSEGGPHVQPKQ
jgi:hypothetical protein